MRFLKEILKSSSLRTLGVFAGGNLFVAVLGGMGGLLQARWIDPAVFGEFRKFGILTSYFYIGLILVHDGLMRQFPYLIGKGKRDDALKVAATAKWWYLLLSWLFSAFFAGLTLVSVWKGDYRSAVGWGAQIPCIWATIYGFYLGVMYRTSFDFKRLSYNNITSSIVSFFALVLVKVWGYWGLAARFALQHMVGLYINRRHLPVKVKAVFDAKGLAELAKISLPLAIPGYIHTSCLTASLSVIILKFCGQSGLGVYGMALTFQTMAMTFTTALNQIFITKLTSRFGETDDVFSCVRYAKVPTLLSVGSASVLALGLSLVVSPFVRLLLPKYVEAIPVIRILAMSLPLSAAGLPLIILRSALWYKSVFALALTRFLVCLTAVALCPKTLTAIAACFVFGEFCSLIVGFGILEWNRGKK
jgi:O-antigen/teichoic acid export membrane protein